MDSSIKHINQCIFLNYSDNVIRVLLPENKSLPQDVKYFSLIPSSNAAALQKIEDFLHVINY